MADAMNRRKIVLLLAIAIDVFLGDPPNRFHPVAWMGALIHKWQQSVSGYAQKTADSTARPIWDLLSGAGLTLAGGLMTTVSSRLVIRLTTHLPVQLSWLIEAALLKATFSLRGLHSAAGQVHAALQTGDLPEARRLLSWHLVSRDTSNLNQSLVAAATIESVAENTGDGVVAPLFYYYVGGLPLAMFYRFANTADAMLGYRTPELEWQGKIPARTDDLLNLLPARLTALMIAFASPLAGGSVKGSLRSIFRDAHRTSSPNAGYPMSAMAGALGVELEKVGSYRLGTGGRKPNPVDIHRAQRIALGAAALALALLLLCPAPARVLKSVKRSKR
jgi:adenosylcobinamide-phosphate synthase